MTVMLFALSNLVFMAWISIILRRVDKNLSDIARAVWSINNG